MTPAAQGGAALPAPGLRRRMAAFVYEGVLLFGVLMIGSLLFAIAADQRHALQGRIGFQIFLFLLLGLYFCWCWTRGGQTLALKTWHVRLIRLDGRSPGWPQAIARYLLSWLWFVPALLAVQQLGLQGNKSLFGAALLIGMLGYALLALLLPDRQFLHDRLCRTRLITWRPAPRRRA